MEELTILEFQAKQIENTLRMVSNVLGSKSKETSLDRDVTQSWEMIKNILAGEKDKTVNRF